MRAWRPTQQQQRVGCTGERPRGKVRAWRPTQQQQGVGCTSERLGRGRYANVDRWNVPRVRACHVAREGASTWQEEGRPRGKRKGVHVASGQAGSAPRARTGRRACSESALGSLRSSAEPGDEDRIRRGPAHWCGVWVHPPPARRRVRPRRWRRRACWSGVALDLLFGRLRAVDTTGTDECAADVIALVTLPHARVVRRTARVRACALYLEHARERALLRANACQRRDERRGPVLVRVQ